MNSTCYASHVRTCRCVCLCKLGISKTRGSLVIAETPSPLFKILSESWLLRVVHRPAAPSSPGSLLGRQNFKFLPQTYCIRNCMLISSLESCTSVLRNTDVKTMTQIPDPGSKVLMPATWRQHSPVPTSWHYYSHLCLCIWSLPLFFSWTKSLPLLKIWLRIHIL